MTIDDRIEFLMHSIESHDRQIGELVERMDRLTERVDRLTERVDRTSAGVDEFRTSTQLNFDRLTTAMLGLTDHLKDHQRRIERLEG